jgi:hypothetical protein
VIDNMENVYVTGSFHGTPDFNPGAGNDTLQGTAAVNSISGYTFLAKYNSSGSFQWAKNLGVGTVYFLGHGAQGLLFHNNSIYVSIPNTNLTTATSKLQNYSTTGSLIFSQNLVGATSIRNIKASNTTDLIITGDFANSVDMDMSSGGASNLTGFYDIFIGKYDQTGNHVWSQKIGSSSSNDIGRDIAVNSSGDIFLTGLEQGQIHLSKWNSSGTLQWTNSIPAGANVKGNEVILNSSGDVVISGFFGNTGTNDFDPSATTVNLPMPYTGYYNDAFVVAYSSNTGSYLWGSSVGGGITQTADVSVDNVWIGMDAAGAIYLGGGFQTDCDFDPSAGTSFQSPVSTVGYSDCFLAKYLTSTIGVEELNKPTITIYPNPAITQ